MRRYTHTVCSAILIMVVLLITPGFFATASLSETYTLFMPVVMRNFDPRWQWSQAFPILLEPRPNNAPVSIIDHAGQFHVFWDTLTVGQRYIYHAWLTPTGWTAPTPIAASLGNSTILYSPVVGEDGRVHLLWHTYLGSGVQNPYGLQYAVFDGQNWSPEEEVYRSDDDIQGMVRLDEQDQAHVTMAGTMLFGTILHTQRTDAGWTPVVEIDPPHSVSLIWPDMAGGIHLYGYVYDYPDEYQVHYSYWSDGTFIISDRQGNGEFAGRQSLLDGQNILHTFWTGQVPVPGGTVNGLRYQCLDNDLNWGQTSVLSGEKDITGPVQKAWDQGKQIALAWKETTSGDIRIHTWAGCQAQGNAKIVPLPDSESWAVSTIALQPESFRVCVLAKIAYHHDYTAVCTGGE